MSDQSAVIAVLLGILQGIFEWLPISSEGNITIALTALGNSPETAIAYALFLHTGTAISAMAYYRSELRTVLSSATAWRLSSAFDSSSAELSYLVIATIMTGVVGIPAKLLFEDAVGELDGGLFVVLIGVLLLITGLLQRISGDLSMGDRDAPDLTDAILVGSLQGVAILPGISRSGVTASALLFRSHDGPSAFRLSFLLSIPAALGAGVVAAVEEGFADISITQALLAVAVSAIVGYLTIDALMRIVERVSFEKICYGLGLLAIIGGGGLFLTL